MEKYDRDNRCHRRRFRELKRRKGPLRVFSNRMSMGKKKCFLKCENVLWRALVGQILRGKGKQRAIRNLTGHRIARVE